MGFFKDWFNTDFDEYRPGDEFSVNSRTDVSASSYLSYESVIDVYLIRNGRRSKKPMVTEKLIGDIREFWKAEHLAEDRADQIVADIVAGKYNKEKA